MLALPRPELVAPAGPDGLWVGRGHALLEKYLAGQTPGVDEPYETVEAENLLLTAGATHVLNRLCGVTATALDLTNARVCVGNGVTAVAAAQTDLQGASKLRKALDGAPSIAGNVLQCSATFLSADANFVWSEAGLSIGDSGVLLNRFLQAFGEKTSLLQWTLTITVTLGV